MGYYVSSKTVADGKACKSITYNYGSTSYDSGHDPEASVSSMTIEFHDGMKRTIKVEATV